MHLNLKYEAKSSLNYIINNKTLRMKAITLNGALEAKNGITLHTSDSDESRLIDMKKLNTDTAATVN